MNTKLRQVVLALLITSGLLLGACDVNVRGNPRESLTVESRITEAQMQEIIDRSIADPLIRSFVVDVRDGYVFVTAERERLDGSATDTMTFRLDLGVADGHLSATISDPRINGNPVDEPRVAYWNERIANQLERAGQRTPNTTLQSVTISADVLTMTWRVEPQR